MTIPLKQSIFVVVCCALFFANQSARGQATQSITDAAQIYLQAGQMIGANDAKNIMSPAASDITYPDYPPFSAAWQRMEKEDFAANQPARDLVRQARSLDHANWPEVNPPGPHANYLNQCRNIANEIGDAAVWQHMQGDDAAAIETIRDLLHLSDLLEQSDPEKTLVNELVSAGIRALAMSRLDEIIAGVKLTNDASDKQSLQTSAARELMQSLLQRPDPQAEVQDLEPTEHLQTNPEAHVDRILITFGRENGECVMAAVSMACHLYQFDNHGWPKSKDDLQKYLPQMPIDPFGDGKQTIGYVLIKGGLPDGGDRPLVYSRAEMNGELFFRTDRPSYDFYTDGDPNRPHAKEMRGGQFRDVAAWVPKPEAVPATQAVEER